MISYFTSVLKEFANQLQTVCFNQLIDTLYFSLYYAVFKCCEVCNTLNGNIFVNNMVTV